VMKTVGVCNALTGKIVHGADIAQRFQFVDTGNAELGSWRCHRLSRVRAARDGSCRQTKGAGRPGGGGGDASREILRRLVSRCL
jgi:hypothetical protein